MVTDGGGGPAYLTVGAVDEGPLSQQVLQGPRQVLGEGGHGENLRHPARHVRHGLVGEAHLQSLVAPLQPAGAGGWGWWRRDTWFVCVVDLVDCKL